MTIRRLLALLALGSLLSPTPGLTQDTTSRRSADSSRKVIDGNITIRVGKDRDSTETDRIEWGRNGVAAGDTVRGDFVNFFGDTDIRGVVLGDAVSLVGDLTVHEGAYVRGDAVSVGGRVRVTGGEVGGNIVTSGRGTWREGDDEADDEADDADRAATRDRDEPHSILGALFAVFVAMAMLGVTGVIAAAVIPQRLDTIARRLEAGVGRAFAAGLILELGFVPILLLVLFTLIITVLGILLIPFAVVALPLLYAVLGALGWFATATLVGRGISGVQGADRGAMMRSVVVGTVVLLLPFALAALLPSWGGGLIALAGGVVWVATTAGFGAAVLSRGGRREG